MAKNIKSVFNENLPIKFNRDFLKKVLLYVDGFVKKDENTINFFGSNLLGVYPLKWLEEDRITWIEDVLKIDDIEGLKEQIHELPDINPKFFISSDPVNLSFIWVAHMALNSPDLSMTDRERLATASINMLQYKFLSSIHTRYFKHPANESIARALYESLDRKSFIKKYGTWQGVLDARTEDILSGSWSHVLKKMDDDEEVIKMVNDIQGRIKQMMNKLTEAFYRLRDADARINATGKFTTMDGEQVIKESVNKYERVREHIHGVIPNRHDFVQARIIETICKVVNTVNPKHLEECLLYISDNYRGKQLAKLEALVDDTIVYMFDIVRKEKIALDHIPGIILKLRSMYRSSRAVDPLLISIRERMGVVVEDALKTHSSSTISSTRIGVILYIVLRALIEK